MSLSFTEETGSCFFIPIVTIVHVTKRLILPEYIADSVLDSVESASLSFLRLYASTSLFLTYSNVNSSSSLASRAVIRVSYSSGRPHSNNVACYLLLAYFFTDTTQLFNESQYSTNVLLHVLVVL